MAGERILVVDDEVRMRRTIRRVLEGLGYACEVAADVAEAREMLDGEDFDLIICDLRMPGESGMTLVEEIEDAERDFAVLVATGVDDPSIARAAARHGIDGYLIKPFTNNELEINVDSALQQHRKRRASSRAIEHDESRARDVRSALLEAAADHRLIDEQQADVLARLSEAVARRDIETGGHIRRIGRHSARLARKARIDPIEAEMIGLAAPMHDVGKVAIPDGILLKPGPLTTGEREVMRRHAEIGHEILAHSDSPLLDMAAGIALTHHERFDGDGYPHGRAGEEIPIEGRIVAIADVFDALTSDRPYRSAMGLDEALVTMRDERGAQFDPELLDCFLENIDEFEPGTATGD